jgi:hypothetical protein
VTAEPTPPEIEETDEETDDVAPGTDELGELLLRITRDAVERGLLEVDPAEPIDYRRVICLTDGTRVDVQMARILPCTCGRIHGRGREKTCEENLRQSEGT